MLKTVVLLSILITSVSFAQITFTDTVGATKQKKTLGSYNNDAEGVGILPVTFGSDTLTGNFLFSQQLIDSLQLGYVADFYRAATDTVGTVSDTLSRKIVNDSSNTIADLMPVCWQGDIYVTDTLQVSTNSAFPATNTTVFMPGQPYPLARLNTGYNTNLYLKVYGTGTPTYYIRVWGK